MSEGEFRLADLRPRGDSLWILYGLLEDPLLKLILPFPSPNSAAIPKLAAVLTSISDKTML
jgi:hypothetical protein